ncbi:hypothetical protein [Microbacterium natoriense]
MSVEIPEWTQVELTGRRSAVGQRWIAGMLTLAGAVGLVLSFFMEPGWWAVISSGLVCLFIVVLGISLWANAGASAAATVELLESGITVPLRVLSAEEIHDDSVIQRLLLRLPVDELVVVQHQCSHWQCLEAAREAPGSEVPAIIDRTTKSWGVVHGRLGG